MTEQHKSSSNAPACAVSIDKSFAALTSPAVVVLFHRVSLPLERAPFSISLSAGHFFTHLQIAIACPDIIESATGPLYDLIALTSWKQH